MALSDMSAPAQPRGLEDLHAKLAKLTVSKSPFPAKVKDEAVTTWVRPSLDCRGKVRGVDQQRQLRQPVYLGLRSISGASDACYLGPSGHHPLDHGGSTVLTENAATK